jgi:alkaline phosphatase
METYTSGSAYQATIPEEIAVHKPIAREAKNFIMLIGDGMGVYQTKIFDYMDRDVEYSDGEDFFYGYMLPYQGFSRTRSYSGITDSAAGGTALSCGYKTYNEYIGRDKDMNDIKSLTELSFDIGKSAAVMSTENQKGATPAAFSAHADSRNSSSAILESQLDAMLKYGTIIDCGFDYYTDKYMRNVIEKGITDTLAEVSANENGFFLMYEEAHIDKHCHKNDINKTYDVVVRFNQAIARFMEFAFYHPDTFVLITADHETGGLAPDENGNLAYSTEDHSADDVPIFAWGYGADAIDGKTVENIEIAKLFASLMGVENFGDQSDEWKNIIYGTEE